MDRHSDLSWNDVHHIKEKYHLKVIRRQGSSEFFGQIFLQMFSLLAPAAITQPPSEPFINYAQGGISPETSSILDFIWDDANY